MRALLRRVVRASGGGVGAGEELLTWNKLRGGYEGPIPAQFCHRVEIFWNSFMASALRMDPVRP
jgi:hypothetical protein